MGERPWPRFYLITESEAASIFSSAFGSGIFAFMAIPALALTTLSPWFWIGVGVMAALSFYFGWAAWETFALIKRDTTFEGDEAFREPRP